MSTIYMTPAIRQAANILDPLAAAGKLIYGVTQGGNQLDILALVPNSVPQLPAGLMLLHAPADALTPTVWADPAAGLVPF